MHWQVFILNLSYLNVDEHLLNKSREPPHPNPLPPGERGVIERNHLKNSLPLDGGGLG